MGNTKKLSNAEREIMEAIWRSGKALCVNDLFLLLGESEWKYTTVATFLTRLSRKGFLVCEKHGNQNYFRAKASREEYLAEQTDEFVKDMYGGDAASLIACFCKEKLSKSDYEELMDILQRYEK